MAEEKGNLLAIAFGKGKHKGDEEKASTPKGRAMKAMWDALQGGDYEDAASAFQDAYDACAMGSDESEASEDEENPLLEE